MELPDNSVTGPPYDGGDAETFMTALAEQWANCSRLMNAVCRANGIRYYHCLQPNQYVPGSRELTPEETAAAFDPEHPYRQGVIKGYPHLIGLGRELADSGVAFLDLTMVYSGVPGSIYIDTCCHTDGHGYEIIGSLIGERILSDVMNKDQSVSELNNPEVRGYTTGSSDNLGRILGVRNKEQPVPHNPDRKILPPIKEELSAM
ncbi:hypothetical protein JW823_01615 [bacterium]|nr:hypothetical protein [candidate division CSSED10-310 bacterium]